MDNDAPWGGLAQGPFAVGFRTAWATDHGRLYGPPSPGGAADAPRRFRPIFVATWYPAAPGADAAPLRYGDYLDVATGDPAFAQAFSERMAAYLRDTTLRYGLEIKPEEADDAAARAALAERERLPFRAVRDAAPAEGRFPVVLYHPGLGGSYEDNGVLCEYLASHGYRVVSSGYQKEDAASLNVNWDLDRSNRDLAFLMNHVAADENADVTRVGAVGQSYGGQALMAWSSEVNNPLRAVVSLDSTVDYAPNDEPRIAPILKPLSRAENVTAAWLLFAVREREPNWSLWDHLVHAPRYLAETGPLGHNDFTSQGLIGTVHRHPDPAEAGRIRRRYEAVCDLTRRFLDARLKDDPDARTALHRQAEADAALPTPDAPLTLAYRPPSPAPAAAP